MIRSVESEQIANRLLLALPDIVLDDMLPKFARVDLQRGQIIYKPGDLVHHNYFVNRGLLSLVKTMRDGRTVEVNTRGIEGVSAPEALFGVDAAILECLGQVPARAFSIRTRDLRELTKKHRQLDILLQRYIHLSQEQMAQTAACNRMHSLEQRCCRWLLIAHDSACADTFQLTHEFLATMLGVQRPYVSTIAAQLQKAGFIRYVRGMITIVDRASLEKASCECYRDVEAVIARYFPAASARH